LETTAQIQFRCHLRSSALIAVERQNTDEEEPGLVHDNALINALNPFEVDGDFREQLTSKFV
jgi:hypothetical protein